MNQTPTVSPVQGLPQSGPDAPTGARQEGEGAEAALAWEGALLLAGASPRLNAAPASQGPSMDGARLGAGASHTGNADDLSGLLAAFSRGPSRALGEAAPAAGRPGGLAPVGLDRAAPILGQGARAAAAAGSQAAAPLLQAAPLLPDPALRPDSPRPLDLLAPRAEGPAGAGTLDGAPWLGLARAAADAPAATSAATRDARAPVLPSSVREAVAQAAPERLAHIREQVTQDGVARVAEVLDASRAARPEADPRVPQQPAPRAAAPTGPQPGATDTAPQAAEDDGAPPVQADTARRPAPPVARPVAPAPAAAPPPVLATDAPVAPGQPAALPGSTTVTRVTQPGPATVVDARFLDGQLPQQIGTPDLTRVELEVEDGDHALKVTLAREADGLAVEVRAPREVVAELRALRPEVDAALAEEGFDLAAYDAEEDPDADAREADDALGDVDTDAALSPDDSTDAPESGRGSLLNRQA